MKAAKGIFGVIATAVMLTSLSAKAERGDLAVCSGIDIDLSVEQVHLSGAKDTSKDFIEIRYSGGSGEVTVLKGPMISGSEFQSKTFTVVGVTEENLDGRNVMGKGLMLKVDKGQGTAAIDGMIFSGLNCHIGQE